MGNEASWTGEIVSETRERVIKWIVAVDAKSL
jgi:hypothetical protein